jgi:hypothetical protein
LDEKFYKMWMSYVVLRDYREGAKLIQVARQPAGSDAGDPTAYCELEKLCIKWGERSVDDIAKGPAP